jgi:hypothetical protein
MATTSVRCPVLGAHVIRVTDLEGTVIRIICPEYETPRGTCRLKVNVQQGGPLAQFLERTAENSLGSRTTSCDLVSA